MGQAGEGSGLGRVKGSRNPSFSQSASERASLPPSSHHWLQHASQGSHGKVEASEGTSMGTHLHLSCVTLSRHFQPQSLAIPSLPMSNA